MNTAKRSLSMILAALLLGSTVSCQGGGSTDTTADTSGDTSADTTAPSESGPKSGVPEEFDLGGETINIWYTTVASNNRELLSDIAGELTGETMDDATFNANRAVEERLGCLLNYYDSGVASRDTGTAIRTLMMADDTTYDLYHGTQWNTAILTMEGLFANMADAPYLSLDAAWWDGAFMSEMTADDDQLYGLAGDFAIDRTRCLSCVFFNKNMFNDFWGDPNALYQTVLDGEWTWDKAREMAKEVYLDVNSNGSVDYDTDRVGWLLMDGNNNDGIAYGMGYEVVGRGDDGALALTVQSEHNAKLFEVLYQVAFETEGTMTRTEADTEHRDKFEEGDSLFLFGFFYTGEFLRAMKDDFGIIPSPKMNSAQENYYSSVHDIMRLMFVPVNCQKTEAVSAYLEEMAFEGWQSIVPAYYDILLKEKVARDDESAQMLDLIRDNMNADPSYIYGINSFNQLGLLPRWFVQGGQNNFASRVAERLPAAEAYLEEFIEKFESLY